MLHPYREPWWWRLTPVAMITTAALALIGGAFFVAITRVSLGDCPGDPTPLAILIVISRVGLPIALGAPLGAILLPPGKLGPFVGATLALLVMATFVAGFEGASIGRWIASLLVTGVLALVFGVPACFPLFVSEAMDRQPIGSHDRIKQAFGAAIIALGVAGLVGVYRMELHPPIPPDELWLHCEPVVHRAELREFVVAVALCMGALGALFVGLGAARIRHRQNWLQRVRDGEVDDHRILDVPGAEALPLLMNKEDDSTESLVRRTRPARDAYRDQPHWEAVARI